MGIKKQSSIGHLFTKTQQRLLGLFYCHPDTSFYTNEIIRLTAAGTGATQRELAKFTVAGYISVKQIGNQKHYQANRSMPFFEELRSIILKTFGLANLISETLEPVKDKIHFAFIYGSIAKQEDTANSDIDLMIIGDKLTYAECFKLLEKTEAQLGRKINPTFYSLSDWIKKHKQANHFVVQTYQQPKIFIKGNEDELAKLR